VIRVTVKGHEGKLLWDRVKDCAGLVARATRFSTLKGDDRRQVEVDLITYLANAGFGGYTSPASDEEDRRTYFAHLDQANPDIFNLICVPDQVELVVHPKVGTAHTVQLGNAIGYSTVIPVTEDAFWRYCEPTEPRFFLYKEINAGLDPHEAQFVFNPDMIIRKTEEGNDQGDPGYLFVEGLFFLPFLGYKTKDARECVAVEILSPSVFREERDLTMLYLDAVFGHIACLIGEIPSLPRGKPGIEALPKNLGRFPRFITGTNPEENVGAALIAMLGFQRFGKMAYSIHQPKLKLDLRNRKAWSDEAYRFVELLALQQRKDTPGYGLVSLEAISLLGEEFLSAIGSPRRMQQLIGKRTLSDSEQRLLSEASSLRKRFAQEKEKLIVDFQALLDAMAEQEFGTDYKTKLRVVSEVVEFAKYSGLDLVFNDQKVNVRVARTAQFQVRRAVKDGRYLYTRKTFPHLSCRDRVQDI